jgi:predicted transcriptional regulator
MPKNPKSSKHYPRRVQNAVAGQVENRLNKAQQAWDMRCAGATYKTISQTLGFSMGAIHNYIEETRALLREHNEDLAARERDEALELLDNAIEKVVPHINGQVIIETIIERGEKPPITMTVEKWQARMKGCQVLVQLLDRKAKLLGMDAPSKVEAPPVVAPETEEQRTRAREALKTWTKFCIDPKDFQVKGLE